MLRSDKILQMKTLYWMQWWSTMLDVDFYRLYNGLWACGLMPCFCRDFCDFYKSLPCFFAILPWFSTVPTHRYRRSVNFGGIDIFSRNYVWKINKMPEFYVIFARKFPNFTLYLPEFFPRFFILFFFWGGATPCCIPRLWLGPRPPTS